MAAALPGMENTPKQHEDRKFKFIKMFKNYFNFFCVTVVEVQLPRQNQETESSQSGCSC